MNPALLLQSESYRNLKRYVLERTGLSYFADRDEDLAARISRRLAALGITDAGEYLYVLEQNPGEADCLVGELTIGETYFFRQTEHFDLLRNTIFPDILERKRATRRLRIWSAGCATGAEPYSIAILLRLHFGGEVADWDVSIVATDINTEFLAQAREGVFGSWALRDTPAEIKARCFRKDGNKWRLLPEFRRWVTFEYHNLVGDAHPSADEVPFDLILCRNVLIYFSQETIRTVARKFFEYLQAGGWLLVGHAEPNAETFAMFETLTSAAGTAYRRSAEHLTASAPFAGFPSFADLGIESLPLAFPPDGFIPEKTPAKAPLPERPIRVAKLEPASLPLLVEDVRVLADRGNWSMARDAANQLVRQDPLNAPARFTLGLILEHAGEQEAAQEALRKAIYLDRGFALAHYHLATLLKVSGDAESAGRAFETVLRLVDGKPPAEPLPHGDGITAHELGDLAKMHLELIAK